MKEKRTRIRRKNAGYKRLTLLLIIVFILILMLTKVIFPATVSLSKFVYSVVKGAYLNSKEFYFTSNRMTRSGNSVYEVKNWGGTDSYKFTVNMYSSKNSLKNANVDIEYEVVAEVQAYKNIGSDKYEKLGEPIILRKDNEGKGSNDYINAILESPKSIISKIGNQDGFDVTVTPYNYTFKDNDYIEIKMTANAISPYTDTISGIYRVYVGKEGMSMRIEDSKNSPYLNVILTNAKVGSNDTDITNVDLIFDPEEVVLDNTSPEYINAKSEDLEITNNFFQKIKVKIKPLESKFIKFYKKEISNNYSYPNEENYKVVKATINNVEI